MKEQLDSMIKNAMLTKNIALLNVLRLIKTEFMVFETAKNATVLDNDAELSILNKMVKQRRDSVNEFTKANRMDLVEKESEEIEIIMGFLPKEGSIEDIEKYVDYLLTTIEGKNMGLFIKEVKTKYPTNDGSVIAKIVKSKLF